MKILKSFLVAGTAIVLVVSGCRDPHTHTEGSAPLNDNPTSGVGLSQSRVEAMGMAIDTVPWRIMGQFVETTGEITVPPQNEAMVTAIVGGNVASIEVIEGQTVRRGHVLAYLTHPDLIAAQSEYIRANAELGFLEKEIERKRTLYEQQVGSGKEFQRTEAAYKVAKAQERSLEAQLRLMGLDPARVREGHLYERVPVSAPIDGSVREVRIKTGQYVQPRTEMFDLVNTDHVHADLMVFEKDVSRVVEGQSVEFTLGSDPSHSYTARIFSVGKSFEKDPKAVHVHADIDRKTKDMLPGMYIHGRIYTDSTKVRALPRGAVVNELGTHYIFTATPPSSPDGKWIFEPVEVRTGRSDGDWVEVNPTPPLPHGTLVAHSNAYHLMAEMQKSETDHSH